MRWNLSQQSTVFATVFSSWIHSWQCQVMSQSSFSSLFQATGNPQSVTVSFRLGWSLLFCPNGFLSAQGPGVVHPTAHLTAPHVPPPPASRGSLWCDQGGGIRGSSLRRPCSVSREDGRYVPLPLGQMSWSVPDYLQ